MVTTVTGTEITNIEASPIVPIDRRVFDHSSMESIMAIEAATTSLDEVNDVLLITLVPSDAVIGELAIKNDDLDSDGSPTLAVDVGLYYSGIGGSQVLDGNVSGTEIDVDLFASAITQLQGQVVTWTEVTNEAQNIDNYNVELWQAGGLSVDPGGYFYIGLKVTTVAVTAVAGGIVVRASYRK